MSDTTHYTVIDSFATGSGDYQEGEVLAAGDPAIKKWPMFFAPLVVRGAPVIEQATSEPGETRKLSIRRKPKAAAAKKPAPAPTPAVEPEPPTGHAITSDSFKGR